MAGLFETVGKTLGLTSVVMDMGIDIGQTGRVYTKDMKTSAKRDVARVNARNEIKEDIKDLQWNAKKERVEKLIEKAKKTGDWDALDDLLEEM